MKRIILCVGIALVGFCSLDAYAWGNKAAREAKKAAKAEAKASKKADKQKDAIKNWQMTRYRYQDVKSAVENNGKLVSEDLAVTCSLPEVQPIVDGLLAGYVTIVNIVDAYVDVEEGNAIVGLVAKKMELGESRASAEASLSATEKAAYDKYLDWLRSGENVGRVAIDDEELEKLMTGATTFKEQMAEIKEKIKGRKGTKMALAKDAVLVVKLAGSSAKGGLILKGILSREKKAKALIAGDK